jgi:E3 ubiquitin-protein ligase RNF5
MTKKVCPICRQKVETNPAAGKFTAKSKGFWPLELKLMTSKKSGKRAAR